MTSALAVGVALSCTLAAAAACGGSPPRGWHPAPLAERYRAQNEPRPRAVVATSVYRDILGKTLFSRCKMWPHDSAAFDLLARRCGIVRATFRSAARLLLERAAHPAFLQPLIRDRQLRWLDEPRLCD